MWLLRVSFLAQARGYALVWFFEYVSESALSCIKIRVLNCRVYSSVDGIAQGNVWDKKMFWEAKCWLACLGVGQKQNCNCHWHCGRGLHTRIYCERTRISFDISSFAGINGLGYRAAEHALRLVRLTRTFEGTLCAQFFLYIFFFNCGEAQCTAEASKHSCGSSRLSVHSTRYRCSGWRAYVKWVHCFLHFSHNMESTRHSLLNTLKVIMQEMLDKDHAVDKNFIAYGLMVVEIINTKMARKVSSS